MMMNPLALMKALRMRRGSGLEIETKITPLDEKTEESFEKTPDQENDEIIDKSKKSKEQEDESIPSGMNDEDIPLAAAPVEQDMDDETMKRNLRTSILKKQKGAM